MRIILADNHPHILRALKTLLQEEPGFFLVGEARSAAWSAGLGRNRNSRPDLDG